MPTTLHLDASRPADRERAAQILREGRLVAFATETVYGLGANALSADAVARIFEAKKRPSWDPLIVHLASASQLADITRLPPPLAFRISALANAFWPGPLTLLLPRNANIPDAVTAGGPLVGVRVPAHPAALALLEAAHLPIAAPSANLYGHTSPTTAAHVLADLDGRIDAVLDAGPTSIGLESTVLDPTQTPMVLYRPGAITASRLTAVTGVAVEIFQPGESSPSTPQQALPSPGVGLRHYAPHARLVLVEGSSEALNRELLTLANDPTHHVGVLIPSGWPVDIFSHKYPAILEPWADWNDPHSLAARLFAGLRSLDDRGATVIVCPLPEPGGMSDAIRDRLRKAARPA
ncbi:MAG: L-threonylcarbamoyladenylate synthase [Acidobacteriota bacterium]